MDTTHSIPMAYNNYINNPNPNSNRYSTSPTYRESNAHPCLDPSFASEEENSRAFAKDWNLGKRPGHVLGLPRDLRAETGQSRPDDHHPGPLSPAASHETQIMGYDHLQYPQNLRAMLNQHAQPHSTAAMDELNYSFTSLVSLETRKPIGAPINYWGGERGLQSMSRFQGDAQTPRQSRSDVRRTGLTGTRRFRPYGTPSTHVDEYMNTEAWAATPEPSHAPYLTPQVTKPSGETTEENVPPRQRVRRGKGVPRMGRIGYHRDIYRLCFWAQEREGGERLPRPEVALAVALKVIENRREPIYPEQRLVRGRGRRTAEGRRGPDMEYFRRQEIRRLIEELSRYYRLEDDEETWMAPALLRNVLDELLVLPIPSA